MSLLAGHVCRGCPRRAPQVTSLLLLATWTVALWLLLGRGLRAIREVLGPTGRALAQVTPASKETFGPQNERPPRPE